MNHSLVVMLLQCMFFFLIVMQMSEKGHSTACGAEDLRNMLERSTSGTKVHRTLSYRGGSSDHTKYRYQGC